MPAPGGSGSQDLVEDFGAELAGGQHEDRLKAEVIEIGLEKRSACVFEVQGVGPSGGLPLARLHQVRGLGDAKVLKSLGHSPKGRHYRG